MPSAEEEKCIEGMDVMKDWDTWLETLQEGVEVARGIGVPEDQIKNMSHALLDYITEEFCPSTDEQRILGEMWEVATPEERRTLVEVFFKLMEK